MITQIKFIPTLILLIFAQLSWATGETGLEIKVIDENSFVFSLEETNNEKVEISIRDENGQVFYSETFNDSKIEAKKYNLKELPTGNYSFLMIFEQNINIQKIVKGNNGIEIDTKEMQKVYLPTFVERGAYLDMDILCNPEVKYSIQIQDINGNTIFNESFKSVTNVQRRFNLTKLEAGKYEVVVQLHSNTFRELYSKNIVLTEAIAAVK